jgi:hypothetical protein
MDHLVHFQSIRADWKCARRVRQRNPRICAVIVVAALNLRSRGSPFLKRAFRSFIRLSMPSMVVTMPLCSAEMVLVVPADICEYEYIQV